MTENIKVLDKETLNLIKKEMKRVGELEDITGHTEIQANRYFRDAMIAEKLGVQSMNENMHGWDGMSSDGKKYENKNVSVYAKSSSSFSLKLTDTSHQKLDELQNGVICTTTFWHNSGTPAFMMIGNTNKVGWMLKNSYNEKCRKTCQVSMINCIKNGFKIVALDYDREKTMATISNIFPTLGRTMELSDIYSESDINTLVSEM